MNLCKAQTLLLAWLLSIISNNVDDGSGQDSVISCTAKEAPAGETASLTCNFNIDVQQAQRNLIVKKFIPGQTEDTPETVSYCYWSGGEPQCTNKDGITCEINNNHMELQFRKATQDCEGLYTCNLFPPDGTPVHSCRLKLADTPSTEQPSEYTTTEETCKTSTENCENLEAKVNGLIAGLVVVLVILLAVIVIFFLFYKRSRYRCVDCRSRQRREHDEDLSSEVDVRFSGLPEPSEDERDSPHPLEPLTQQ